MTDGRRLTLSPGAAIAMVVSVLAAGAGGTYLFMRNSGAPAYQGTAATASNTPGAGAAAPQDSHGSQTSAERSSAIPDAVVTLTQDAIERAGIGVEQVSTRDALDGLRLPGVVEPNAYRQVAVTPLVGGRVVSVSPQLGDRVRRGQLVAEVYSPELAEARTKYVAAKAMLEAHDRELQRSQKLVEIGAASQQELERIHAEHAAQTAEVESARSRLQLLGADVNETPSSDPDVRATTRVPAPIDGVVTERLANVGLNVDPTTRLLTIVDLSNVWVIADVYERDLHLVREGDRAAIATKAYPDLSLQGRVSYIDPQLNAATRTAKVRIEVSNPRGDLRLGMYADVAIASARTAFVVTVPQGAVQNVGDRQVVYLPVPNEAGKFVEREVRIGRSSNDQVEVLSGLTADDAVVAKGSFFIRAELERLGLRASQSPVPAARQP